MGPDIKKCVERAVGLSDRARIIAAGLDGHIADEPARLSIDSEQVIDFDCYGDEETFAARLNELGCSPEEFEQALDPDSSVVSTEDQKLGEFFSDLISTCPSAREWMLKGFFKRKDRHIDMSLVLPTLQNCALIRFQESFAKLESHPGISLPEIRRRQGAALSSYLINLCAPALVTEMQALRLCGRLRGQNSSNRFKDFVVRHTMDPRWVTYFFSEYPVLLRLCRISIETRINAITEIAHRFEADHDQIAEKFNISFDDQLIDIEVGKGDTHQEGRTVAKLHFASGARLIYKPRSLQLDKRFQDLLHWLASNGLEVEFKSFKILERNDYAWVEFIQHTPCHSRAEVERFFYRQGSILAVIHMLGGYDMIHENIIASGEHPYCIDIECAYSKSLPIANAEIPRSSYVKRLLMESVTTTGMLPSYSQGDAKGAGFIGGGMAIVGGQTRHGRVPGWINENTDEMRQVLRKFVIEDENANIPHLGGEAQNPFNYLDEILRGFETAYRILMDAADELVDTDGPIARLMECPSRVLFRPTSAYSQCQNALLHPDSFTSGLAATKRLETMWGSTSDMIPPGVVQSELDQLWNGDIPFFVSNGNSRDVMDFRGNIVAKDYFVETGLEKIRRRMEFFGEADLALQLKLIDLSFRLFCSGRPKLRVGRNDLPQRRTEGPSELSNTLMRAAEVSAEKILAKAYQEGEEIGWIDPKIGQFGTWKIDYASPGLYDGLTGYCMFFLYMYEVQEKNIYRETAVKIWNQILRDIEYVRKFASSTTACLRSSFPDTTGLSVCST